MDARAYFDVLSRDAARATTESKVLVADDDPAVRNAIAGALRARHIRVLEAEDPSEVMDLLGTLRLERVRWHGRATRGSIVVVADVRIATLDQLLAGMRHRGWRVSVILVSSLDYAGVSDAAFRLSASGYFRKPFDLVRLCDAVEALLYPARGAS